MEFWRAEMSSTTRRRRPPVATGMKAGSLLQYFSVQIQPPSRGDGNALLTDGDGAVQARASTDKEEARRSQAVGPPDRSNQIEQSDQGETKGTTDCQVAPGTVENIAIKLMGRRTKRMSASPDVPVTPSASNPATLHPDVDTPNPPRASTDSHSNPSTPSADNGHSAAKKAKLDTSLSEYERQRLEKIQQNAAFLASLGMDRLAVPLPQQSAPATKKARRPRQRREPQSPPVLRRSTRQTPSTSSTAPVDEITLRVDKPSRPAIEVPTDTAALVQYLCEQNNALTSPPRNTAAVPHASLRFMTSPAHDRADPQLKRVYSMASSGSLLAAAGHNGYLSLYSRDVMYQSSPLLSFRAHQGWCSGVTFNLTTPDTCRLLTAANDGVVKLWAVDPSASQSPMASALQLVTSSSSLHDGGIFSIDAQQANAPLIATGSKDHTVALSQATPTGFALIRTFDSHAGVVKCVRFSSASPAHLASCGNDMTVVIHDTRTDAAPAPAITLAGHSRAANRNSYGRQHIRSVRWAPTCAHTVVSTGFDGNVLVWDVRRPVAPVLTYTTPERKRMFPAEFLGSDNVVVGADGALVVYGAQTHAVKSRGDLEYDADTLLVQEAGLLVAHRQTVSWFRIE